MASILEGLAKYFSNSNGSNGASEADFNSAVMEDYSNRNGINYGTNSYNGSVMPTQTSTFNPSSTMSSGLGFTQLVLDTLGALQDHKNYKLTKEGLAFNMMDANRNYEANRTKYNNAVARTNAVNDFYGSKNVAKQI